MRKVALGRAGLAIFAFLAVGCNSQGGGTGPGTSGPFKIHGIFLRDLNRTNQDVATFQLFRNDTLFKLATATLAGVQLDTIASGYFKESPQITLSPGQPETLQLMDSASGLNFSTSLAMPDTFGISNIQPPTRLATGGNGVSAEWTASANASGYIVAVVHDDTALSSQVDTSFFPDFATSTSVSPFAFQNANNQVVTGLYRIYVIAFRGGLFPYPGKPFPLPPNYSVADTNYSLTVAGRIVSAFVAKYDTVRVP